MTERPDGPLPYTPQVVDYATGEPYAKAERDEMATLGCTKEALAKLDRVYEVFQSTSLWPHNVSHETLRQATVNDPEGIGSHYSVVRQTQDGLESIPYHKLFERQLEPVADWVTAAQNNTKNKEFKGYLDAVNSELVDGGEINHEYAVKRWLEMKSEPIVDLVCGFTDRYADTSFNLKFAPQGWTGLVDREKTKEVTENIKRQIEIWRETVADQVHAPDYAPRDPKVKGRYDKTQRFSGLAGQMRPSANNLPCEQELRDKFGSKITIFGPSLEYNTTQKRTPVLRKIIPYEMRRNWTQDDINQASILYITAHEPNHSLIRRETDEQRLGNEYTFMNEMYATTLGMAILGLREDVSDHMKNVTLGFFFATVAEALQSYSEGDTSRFAYLKGFRVIFNSLVEKQLVRIEKGQIKWSDPRKIYDEFLNLSITSEAVIAKGDIGMARTWRRAEDNDEYLGQLSPFILRIPESQVNENDFNLSSFS